GQSRCGAAGGAPHPALRATLPPKPTEGRVDGTRGRCDHSPLPNIPPWADLRAGVREGGLCAFVAANSIRPSHPRSEPLRNLPPVVPDPHPLPPGPSRRITLRSPPPPGAPGILHPGAPNDHRPGRVRGPRAAGDRHLQRAGAAAAAGTERLV